MIDRYVYMLSTYDEHGSVQCRATLDRNRLVTMLTGYFYDGNVRPEYLAGLTKLLQEPDERLADDSGTNLSNGWGGMQLHVIKLED